MKDKKKIGYTILIIGFIIIALVTFYFLFSMKNNDKKDSKPTPTTEKKIKKGEIQFSSEPFEAKTKPDTKGMTDEEKEAIEYASAAFNYDEFEFGKPKKSKDGFYEIVLTERKTKKSDNVFRVNLETGEQTLEIRRYTQKEECPECEKSSN
ncbi:MAG: hypothetical protein KH135_02995 [Firmicutes bacterium]|nr:hypothetical protein [Bacillota bacterium]